MRRVTPLLVVLVLAAGCQFGSDSGEADFIKEADTICADYERRIANIPPPQTFLRDFAVYMRRVVPIAREQNRKLRALQAPGDDTADFRRMLSLLDRQLDMWAQAGELAFDGNDQEARATFSRSSVPGEEAQRIAAEIGFFSCARPEG